MNTVQNGKGSKPRPVDKKSYDENHDRIFKKCEACKGRCEIGKLKGGVCL